MDPFRDELAAAHAKIAQLEAEKHELREALKQREQFDPPQLVPTTIKNTWATTMWIIVGFGALFFVSLVAMTYITIQGQRPIVGPIPSSAIAHGPPVTTIPWGGTQPRAQGTSP